MRIINNELPRHDIKYFYLNREVKIVKSIPPFHLAKIVFVDTKISSIVDISTLSVSPDKTKSVSLKLLGGL